MPRTRGFRLVWLCEELALPYALERVDFSAEYRASAAWRRMNPVGKVPVMVDGDLVVFESGAMLEYLLARYGDGRLQPAPGSPEHGIFLQWCWFAEATFGRVTGEIANHKRAFAPAPKEDVLEETRGRARVCMQALDAALGGRRYLLGDDFTAADVMMGYTVQSFDRHVAESHPPNVAAWWTRIEAREGYRCAIAAEDGL